MSIDITTILRCSRSLLSGCGGQNFLEANMWNPCLLIIAFTCIECVPHGKDETIFRAFSWTLTFTDVVTASAALRVYFNPRPKPVSGTWARFNCTKWIAAVFGHLWKKWYFLSPKCVEPFPPFSIAVGVSFDALFSHCDKTLTVISLWCHIPTAAVLAFAPNFFLSYDRFVENRCNYYTIFYDKIR